MPRVPSIFIIDDVPDNIGMLSKSLAGVGHIRFALSGARGIEKILQHKPDIILLDVMMPEMDGYQVLAELMKHPDVARTPVIFVTAKNDPFSESAAINAGAVDFINKPINPTVVKARVCMHLALQAREREVQLLNSELEQRVQERTQALKDALVKAQSAQKTKANLLANLSHEFRTPLNIVLGMTYMASKQVDNPKVVDQLSKISISGKSLLALLNDILDLARLESNRFELETIDFNLAQVMQASLGTMITRAGAKGLTLTLEIDDAVPRDLHGDPVRFGQILNNFVSNAIKFSSHGLVSVRVRQEAQSGDQHWLRFEVQDQGVGVRTEDQQRIFNSFEQADGSLSRAYGGAGIGLTISQMLTQLMGGKVGMQSQEGHGSTFWAEIPFKLGAKAHGAGHTQQVVGYLMALLEEDGSAAQAVWQISRTSLQGFMGVRAETFAQAMERFDFADALQVLKTVVDQTSVDPVP